MKERGFSWPLTEAIVLTLLFFLLCEADTAYAVSLSWQFCFGLLFVTLLFILPGFLLWARKRSLSIFAAFCVVTVALRFVYLSPVKPFVQFQNSLSNGTTLSELNQHFVNYFPPNGRFRQPVKSWGDGSPATPYDNEPLLAGKPDKSIHYILDPNDGRYNAELLIVYLQNDRVVGTEYLAD